MAISLDLLPSGEEIPAEQVLWLNFAACLPPEPHQGRLIVAHDNPGIRAPDKASSFSRIRYSLRRCVHRV